MDVLINLVREVRAISYPNEPVHRDRDATAALRKDIATNEMQWWVKPFLFTYRSVLCARVEVTCIYWAIEAITVPYDLQDNIILPILKSMW